jgi:hypothetical protein
MGVLGKTRRQLAKLHKAVTWSRQWICDKQPHSLPRSLTASNKTREHSRIQTHLGGSCHVYSSQLEAETIMTKISTTTASSFTNNRTGCFHIRSQVRYHSANFLGN